LGGCERERVRGTRFAAAWVAAGIAVGIADRRGRAEVTVDAGVGAGCEPQRERGKKERDDGEDAAQICDGHGRSLPPPPPLANP
jgi:hypothetical protein